MSELPTKALAILLRYAAEAADAAVDELKSNLPPKTQISWGLPPVEMAEYLRQLTEIIIYVGAMYGGGKALKDTVKIAFRTAKKLFTGKSNEVAIEVYVLGDLAKSEHEGFPFGRSVRELTTKKFSDGQIRGVLREFEKAGLARRTNHKRSIVIPNGAEKPARRSETIWIFSGKNSAYTKSPDRVLNMYAPPLQKQ